MEYRSEYDLQCAVFEWAARQKERWPEIVLMRSSLAGTKITLGQQMKAKRAGFKTGYPDIMLDHARGGYHGLRIELKTKKGTLSRAQKLWIQALTDQGFYAYCCKGFDPTIECITRYFEMEA
jgi:hypothetical protein